MCIRDSIARRMRLLQTKSLQTSQGLSSFVRNASFSRGWLHIVVQGLFAVIIVASFILIILMSLPKFPSLKPVPDRGPRCRSSNCMVYCEKVPYFGRFEEDIIYSVSRLPDTCTGFDLTLHEPMFVNETLPTSWIPRLRIPIHELAIIAGNLKHLPSRAFLNQHAASIRTLLFQDIVIKTWATDNLVGLSNLVEIYLKECKIFNIHPYILRPVDDTLESLTITKSGKWDPVNFTGTTNLLHVTTVDFSKNIFYDVLGQKSFKGIENCKVLYLNSCKISAIGVGAFDNLRNIEMLFLNDNLLVTVPTGLFNNIILLTATRPRINLQDNLWNCDCSVSRDIKQLVTKDMLLTDVTCTYPESYKGKSVTELESYCYEDSKYTEAITTTESTATRESEDVSGFVYINSGCFINNVTSNVTLKLLSPVYGHKCVSTDIHRRDISRLYSRIASDTMESHTDWIKFTFFLKTETYSMVQVGATEANKYGLLWYQSTCPNEVYCVNVVPNALRVYNVDMNAKYLFCPVLLASGALQRDKCVYYNLSKISQSRTAKKTLNILLYVSTGGICLVVGALCVYALVRKHPNLLKGSKRILFVKHKSVEALVLPPKIPIRNNSVNEITPESEEDNKIFVVPANSFGTGKINRNKSTRSSKSNAPSYISALQPTDDQLAEWRIRNHFTNELASEISTYSWLCNTDPSLYTDIIENDKTYESL